MEYLAPYVKHAFLVLVGILILLCAYVFLPAGGIIYAIFLNIGSDLIAVTVVFFVFQFVAPPKRFEGEEGDVPKALRNSLSPYSVLPVAGSPERDFEDLEEGE